MKMNGSSNGGPCGACKLLRRKCVKGSCVFAPYFEPDERGTTEFEAVHRVFGAKNVAKILLTTPPNNRLDAVVSLSYEAVSRVRDPVYGCVAQLFNLQQQVEDLQAQLAYVKARLSILKIDRQLLSMSGTGSVEVAQETISCGDEAVALMFEEESDEVDMLLADQGLLTSSYGLKTRPTS